MANIAIGASGVFTKILFDRETKRLHVVAGKLAPDDFDKSGKMTLWKLSKYLQGCRVAYHVHLPWYSTEIFRTFVLNQDVQFLPAYSTDINYNSSLKITMWLAYVGNTSFIFEYVISDYVTGVQLANARTQMVLVDVDSRRPVRVPDQLRDNLIDSIQPNILLFPSKPTSHFKYKLSVASSDTDWNQHTNQASYIRMCMDASSAGALEGHFSFPKEVVYYNPKSVQVHYIKESRMGESIEIACWEDKSSPISIYCEVTKGSELICQCQMKFSNISQSKSKL